MLEEELKAGDEGGTVEQSWEKRRGEEGKDYYRNLQRMKKEGGNVIQEIRRQYGLDKYVANDYTSVLFKDFYKFGGKLLKIANYEEMQKKGKSLTQEMLGLIEKKEQFQSRLSILQYALDVYASSGSKLSQAKASSHEVPPVPEPPKLDLEGELKRHLAEQTTRLALFFAVGSVAEKEGKWDRSPVGEMGRGTQISALVKLCQSIVVVQADPSITLSSHVEQSAASMLKLLQGSSDPIDPANSDIHYSDIARLLADLSQDRVVLDAVFHLAKPPASLPPGLFPQTQSQSQTLVQPPPQPELQLQNQTQPQEKVRSQPELRAAIVGTSDLADEDEDTPPDPAKRMPVSLLVAVESPSESQSVPTPEPPPPSQQRSETLQENPHASKQETTQEVQHDVTQETEAEARVGPPPGVMPGPTVNEPVVGRREEGKKEDEEPFTIATGKGEEHKRRIAERGYYGHFERSTRGYRGRRRGWRGEGRPYSSYSSYSSYSYIRASDHHG